MKFGTSHRNRRQMLAFGALLTFSTAMPWQSAQATDRAKASENSRPNIVIILADDFGVEGVGAYGGEYATPNIDALAQRGVRFDNAHATPLCTPTRTRMLTGRENAKNYKAFGYLDPKERTIAHAFREAGYKTGVVGKWQLGGNGFDGLVGALPDQAGFDESSLWQVKNAGKGSRYWGPTHVTNGQEKVNEWGFGPDLQQKWALDFIQNNKDKPFLLFYSVVLPHSPFVPTPDTMSAEGTKARFGGMVRYLDKMVGGVSAKLAETGLGGNTIILFAGDNGTARAITTRRNGADVRGGKGSPGLTGTHVPMIMSWEGNLPAASVKSGLFDIMDVFPTLAEAAGVPIAKGSVDGVSQWPVAVGKSPKARDTIFMHYAPVWLHAPARFAFNEQWKLYGSGEFASLDPKTGTETPVTDLKISIEAAKARRALQRVLDSAGDGPLNPNRFPMCAGQPSVSIDQPATIAGCQRDMSGGNE